MLEGELVLERGRMMYLLNLLEKRLCWYRMIELKEFI